MVDENGIKINDAGNLWGRDVDVTTDTLLGLVANPQSASVACIGPAGENLVRFAAIMDDKSRAVGRGGVGAVKGLRNLKAIVASGTSHKVLSTRRPSILSFTKPEKCSNRVRLLPSVSRPTARRHWCG